MSPSSEDMVQEYHLLDVDKDHIEAKILPYCSVRYALRTWLLLATMLTVGFHVAFYIGRLNIRYHGATYVAVLGLDHRMGWLAIGSFAATILSLPMHLVNTQWRVRSKADLPTSSSQGYRVIVLAAVFAAIVQDILLTLTNRLSAFGVFGLRRTLDLRFLCACLALVIAFKFRRWVPRSATTVVVFAWLLLVAMLQLVYDIKEVMEIHGELYHPWNYRWAVKTPPWRA
ncbi:MAG: hypothetical protein L6R39_006542 [Caloplaca ligustica]|nr:MAG: hypothetical protein L6R39_006542 [Caloplaca ligustica]